jgi:hypothetical protein
MDEDDDDDVFVLEKEGSQGATRDVAATAGEDKGNGDLKDSTAIAKSLFVLEKMAAEESNGEKISCEDSNEDFQAP